MISTVFVLKVLISFEQFAHDTSNIWVSEHRCVKLTSCHRDYVAVKFRNCILCPLWQSLYYENLKKAQFFKLQSISNPVFCSQTHLQL